MGIVYWVGVLFLKDTVNFEKLSSDSDFSELSIDSTYVKAHKAAAGAKKGLLMQSEWVVPVELQRFIWLLMKKADLAKLFWQPNDCDSAYALLKDFNLQGKTVIADRAYSTFAIKNFIETCSAQCCIPPKSNFKISWDYDKEKYKRRNKIERFFGHLKEKRHISTRFDKLASRFLSFVYLASIFSWL